MLWHIPLCTSCSAHAGEQHPMGLWSSVICSAMCLALPTVAPPQYPADASCTQRQERQGATHQHCWPAPSQPYALVAKWCYYSALAPHCVLLAAPGRSHREALQSVLTLVGWPQSQPSGCKSVAAPCGGGPWGLGFAQGSAVCGVSLVEQAPSPSSPKPLPLGSKANSLCFLAPKEALPCPASSLLEEAAVGARAGGTSHRARARQRLSTDEGSRFLFLTKIVLTDGKNFFRNNLVVSILNLLSLDIFGFVKRKICPPMIFFSFSLHKNH